MKPSWDEAPEWAMWLAQDPYGLWSFFMDRPRPGEVCWKGPWGRAETKMSWMGTPTRHWQQTLERRPSVTSDPLEVLQALRKIPSESL